MKLGMSMLSLTLPVSFLLVTVTICHALSYDVDSQNLEGPNGRFSIPEHLDLKQLYDELYKGGLDGGVEKRAPAAGFYGMRGKKVPSQSFYGMRGKKAPSGFMGMRGKKMMESHLLNEDTAPMTFVPFPVAVGGDDFWNSKEMTKEAENLKKLLTEDVHDESKRAPSQGFLGLRGKRG